MSSAEFAQRVVKDKSSISLRFLLYSYKGYVRHNKEMYYYLLLTFP